MPSTPIVARQDASSGGTSRTRNIVIGVFVAVAFIAVTLMYIVYVRRNRCQASSKYITTSFLKIRWRPWQSKHDLSTQLHADESNPTLYLNRSARQSSHLTDIDQHETLQHDSTIDRHASVRSVATLPAYSKSVRENEQILGREGERAGIDVVLENPETLDEEEERREEEMSSLYNIRQQRRQELAEREDRRQRRREARERGDTAAVMAIRQESLWSARDREVNGAAALVAQHQSRSRTRGRRVSSVSYGDLGVARHDGSRVRAGSAGSDRQPLLDSAASISGLSLAAPAVTRDSLGARTRGRSTSSITSAGSNVDSDYDMPPFGRAGGDFEVVTMNQLHSRNGSRAMTPSGHRSRASSGAHPLSIDGRRSRASSSAHRLSIDTTAQHQAILPEPPAYDGTGFEEAPAYVSPATERANASQKMSDLPQIQTQAPLDSGAPVLPEIGRLPSIRIAEATPISPRPPHDFPAFQ